MSIENEPGGEPAKREPLDLGFLTAYIQELKKSSPTKQVVISGAGGFCSGMIVAKVGRAALFGLGVSGILLHLAQRYGYVSINRSKIDRDLKNIAQRHELGKKVNNIPKYLESLQEFLRQNGYIGFGYAGGLVIGLITN